MKVLCVAEKPSIAKAITGILSSGSSQSRNTANKYIKNYDFSYRFPPPLGGPGDADFTVTSVLGHLTSSDFDDDHRKWNACDPFDLFDAQVQTFVSADLKSVERNLQQEARNANLLMIWTDCDREGEHIGSEVAAVCRRVNRNLVVKRARFSAIIPAQIHQACRTANDLDMRQANAVEARINLDLKIGAAFTRLTTMGLQHRIPGIEEKQVISYGPCQFPTLGFVVDQYNRVQSFVPEPFWYIYVAIERENDVDEGGDSQTVEFKWRRNHLFGFEEALVLYELCVTEPTAKVLKVETKPATKWKPLPLTTVELQQSGSRLLHMAPKKVLDIAEKLYQKGCLSYPRTETDQYDKDFDFNSLIQKQTFDNDWGAFAKGLLDGEFQRPRNGKKNDKAHPPIHPTAHNNALDADERRVFELVTRRFLASCHRNAEGKTTSVEIDINGEEFSTSGLIVTQRNYLNVYPYDKWNSSALPDFDEGEEFVPSVCELRDGQTSKPNLLTEADLVGLMDKNGIGTDATIAEHIAKIIDRQYVLEKQEQKVKYLLPSLLGIGLVEGFNRVGLDRSLSKPQLRAETEYSMGRICEGVLRKEEVLETTIEQYKEVYMTVKREFDTVMTIVNDYMNGQGEVQDALRTAVTRGRGRARGTTRGVGRGGRGGRGGGATGRTARDDSVDDDADDSENGGGGAPRGGARGRASASRGTRAVVSTRGRGAARRVEAAAPRRPRIDDSTDNGVDMPTCECDVPAVQRTVMRDDSAHKGRTFWTCAKPMGDSGKCGFFAWTDEEVNARAGPSRGRTSPAPPPSKRLRTMGPSTRDNHDEVLRCDCGLEAVSRTTTKEGPNQGRTFWTCPNNPKARCKYFQWEDELEGTADSGPGRGSNQNRGGSSSGAGGGASQGQCFNCGQEGHWSNVCPNGGGASSGAGRSSKHSYKSRTGTKSGSRKANTSGGGGSSSKDACYKCGQPGHWASQCPGA
ncbi:putative DNA topoisomerase type I [Kockovaella imperatae]|uniref:DNA topoisomerase n=1 Tax=Kockovaella imperatae TaxID=4999 RepID=A0A1Y1UNY2_9TREE|nr:putative DNA topoisomerase type I [Kockovaella imperatae]ORX38825.1 putative DNA topoisomerase type I [Kockovaella imperatae]